VVLEVKISLKTPLLTRQWGFFLKGLARQGFSGKGLKTQPVFDDVWKV